MLADISLQKAIFIVSMEMNKFGIYSHFCSFFLVYCRPMSTQIIVQTDVVQAIFSHVLMVARQCREACDVTKERFNCSCHPCFQGKYCEIGRHDLFLLV